jgi:hypothetical protein
MVRSRHPPQLDIKEKLWLNEDIGVADSALELVVRAAAPRSSDMADNKAI